MSRMHGQGAAAPRHLFPFARSGKLLVAAALAAGMGGCASTQSAVSSSFAGPTSSAKAPMFPESKWGVSASRRVAGPGERIPKGGGTYKIGSPYEVGGRWYNPREQPEYDRVANVGYLVRAGGVTLWHPGDSFDGPADEVLGGTRLDVLLVPVSGPWLRLADTIDVVRAQGARVVVPVHDALLSDVGHAVVHRILGEQCTGGSSAYVPLAVGQTIDVTA